VSLDLLLSSSLSKEHAIAVGIHTPRIDRLVVRNHPILPSCSEVSVIFTVGCPTVLDASRSGAVVVIGVVGTPVKPSPEIGDAYANQGGFDA